MSKVSRVRMMKNHVTLCAGMAWLMTAFSFAAPGQNSESTQSEPAKTQEAQAPSEKVDVSRPPKVLAGTEKPAFRDRNPRYKLRYGDVIELKFPFTPEFDQKAVTVHPDGFIPLIGIGDIRVEGLTEAELSESIRAAYSKILRNPTITINLVVFETPYFIVGGEVHKPGKFDLRGDTTVGQAVNIAGSFTDMAKHSQVLLFRRVSDEWVSATELDLKKMFKTGDLSEDLHLQPGDMVFVPKSFMGKIKPFLPRSDTLLWMGLATGGITR